MTYLTQLLNGPKKAFGALDYCFHYHKPEEHEGDYAIWKEDSEEDFNSDNRKSERAIEGMLDFYTLDDFNPKVDELETVMESFGASWRLASSEYEEQTNLIHYSWDWSLK